MHSEIILYIAIRNLLKNKNRTLITIGGLAIAVAIIVFLLGLGYGIRNMVIRDFTTFESLRSLDVTSEKSTLVDINNETLEGFRQDNRVDDVYPIVELGARLEYNNSITDVAVISYGHDTVGMWDGFVLERNFEKQEFKDKNIIVSSAAINLIGVEEIEGETVNLDIVTENFIEDTDNVQDEFNVITTTDNSDTAIVLLPIDYLQEAGLYKYTATKVLMKDQSYIDEYRTLLERDGFKTRTAYDTVNEINSYFDVLRIGLVVFGVIAVGIAVLGMFNTLTVSLMEKIGEIGIMKALGARDQSVFKLFIAESVIITAVGTFVGILFGVLMSELIQLIIRLLGELRNIESMADLFDFPLDFIIILFTILLVVGLFTGVYPARRAARTKALDALRYE